MPWQKRTGRKGKSRLPESQRRRIIARDRRAHRGCWFGYPRICLGIDQRNVEIHHIVDAEDGGPDLDHNLVTACQPCHTYYSAHRSSQRAWDWKRKPERHPGVIDSQ